MKTYICIKKIRTRYNKIKCYVLKECDPNDIRRTIGKPMEFTRKDIVALIRDKEHSKILNLYLTYNNRVTHRGPLSMKAIDEVEKN